MPDRFSGPERDRQARHPRTCSARLHARIVGPGGSARGSIPRGSLDRSSFRLPPCRDEAAALVRYVWRLDGCGVREAIARGRRARGERLRVPGVSVAAEIDCRRSRRAGAQRLSVTEPPSALDPDTSNPELGPGFVAYSASGDVTAPVVYANYGLPADYAQLAARGIDVRGKLVIARYGKKSSRGEAVHGAGAAGAAGLLHLHRSRRRRLRPRRHVAERLLADAGADPARQRQVQLVLARRSADAWHRGRDGRVAPRSRRPRRRCRAFPPRCSRGDRRDGFSNDSTANRPRRRDFSGGFRSRTSSAPAPCACGCACSMNDDLRTIRDVVARVPGARMADRGVLLGTHHDAWTFGGVDPGTGTAALLEVARASRRASPRRLAARSGRSRSRSGTPRNSVSIGSTEYAEQRAARAAGRNDLLHQHGSLHERATRRRRRAVAARFSRRRRRKTFPTDRIACTTRGCADEWIAPVARADERDAPELRGRAQSARQRRGLRAVSGFSRPCRRCRSSSTPPAGTATVRITRTTTRGASWSTWPIPGSVAALSWRACSARVALRLGESQVLPFRFSHYAQRLDEYVEAAFRRGPLGSNDGRICGVARLLRRLTAVADRARGRRDARAAHRR